MKKIIMVILALAVGISYIPVAKAGETASFGLTVNFDIPNEPLSIWTVPEGLPKGSFVVQEGETLEFSVFAEDKDTINVDLYPIELTRWGNWIVDEIQPISLPRREGLFRYRSPIGKPDFTVDAESYVDRVVFAAENYEGEKVELVVEITVTPLEPVLSIVVEPDMLTLVDKIKLGEIGRVVGAGGILPIVTNVGNVSVSVGIGYGPMSQVEGMIKPGLE